MLDHPTRQLIAAERHLSAEQKAERLADYFAGCVLMPKRWLKSMWATETQSVEKLAARFEVTPRAMSVRLSQLGLTEPVRRCDNPPSSYRPWSAGRRSAPRRYYRQLSTSPTGLLV